MLSGCLEIGGGSSGDSDDGHQQEEQRVSITGFAVKGILAGAIVEAYDITGTILLASTTTNADGKYTLPAFEHDGPVLVKLKTQASTQATCDSAVGCDDGSGTPIPFGTKYTFNDAEFDLSAVLPSATEASEQELMVTPVTHMAAVRVQAAVVEAAAAGEEFTGADVEGLNRATATLLGLDGIDINKVAPVDITDATATNAGSDAAQLYGTLVASIQTIAEKDPEASIADVINDLAEDYADTGGLVSNSADEDKVTLEEIFSEAIEVVAAAEEKATDEGVEVDLDAAETQLDTEQAEAENATPDVVVEVEPEVVIPEETMTQAQATQLGIDLLLDLNTWEDALTSAQNQTLSQPFIDQLEGTDAILANIDDQSGLMRGVAKLIGEEHEVEYCYYWDTSGNCLASDTESEFEAGPVLKVVGVIGSLAQLATEIENSTTIITSPFDYSAQIDTAGGISIEDLNDIISEEDAAGVSTVVYDLDATFTMTDDKITSITFVMDSAEAAYPIDFNITLTQTDLEATSNKIAYAVSASSINLPDDNIVLSIPQGTAEEPKGIASFTFATAADRIAFSATDVGDPSLAKLTAVDVHFESQGVLSGATTEAGTAIPTTTANLSVDFDYDYDAAAIDMPTTSSRLALGITASNTDNEEINGELVVTAKGDFAESEVTPTFFEQTMDLKDAEAKFVGKIINTATDAAGIAQKAEFNGSIDANMGFFSPATTVAGEDQLVDKALAKLNGSIFVSTTPNSGEESKVGFAGSAEITLALVKTPQGVPFKLQNEEQYHVEKVKLFGRISADQDISMVTDAAGVETMLADRSASLAINAVVNADIAGLQYNQADLPMNGDVLAHLKYGIRSIDADNAVAFIDRTEAIDAAVAALVADGVEARLDSHLMANSSASFVRTNCNAVGHTLFQLCDVTSTENFVFHDWFPSPLTDAEALAQAQEHVANNHNPFDQAPIPELETFLTTTGGDAVIDHASCSTPAIGQLTDTCQGSRTYTASTDLPADVTEDYDRQFFLKGLDAELDEHLNRTITVSECSVDAADATMQNCTITETSSEHRFFNPESTPEQITAELNNSFPDFTISNIMCENGNCSFDKTKSDSASVNATLTPDSIAVIQQGKMSYSSYQYQVSNCVTKTCDVTLTSNRSVGFPGGLTAAERDTYFPSVENGYVNRTSTLTLNSCETHDDGSMECSFNQTMTHVHNQFINDNVRGLTKFMASISQFVTNNGASFHLNAQMDSQYGDFSVMTPYSSGMATFTGDIAAGETEEQEVPLVLHYFEPEFDAEELATGEDAYVQVSANITIKADLTGLDNAEVSVFVNRLGEEDATGHVRLSHGSHMVELKLNSTEMLTNGGFNNFTISNENAEMTLVLTCATDTNDAGVHDNDHITACDTGINMQGDIFVGEFKVAELEDRNGLPVFNFENGNGYDLVITPNFVVQPSAPQLHIETCQFHIIRAAQAALFYAKVNIIMNLFMDDSLPLRPCCFLLLFLTAPLLSFATQAEEEVQYKLEHFSYAGPMAVLQLANNWHGNMKPGRDAISFFQHEISIKKNNFTLGLLSRSYHQFSIENDFARGFYYYNNEISLDEELRVEGSVSAKTYSGMGLRLAYDFLFNPFSETSLRLTPSIVALRLDDIIWGQFKGELFYSDTDNWGGTIDLEYGYTKDHIVRRPLKGESLGQLYGLDLESEWKSPWLDVIYQGINLFSRVYWDGLPKTKAQVSTETAFLLFGYEYFDDVILHAPALHYIQASGPLSNISVLSDTAFNWLTSARVTPIKSFYYHGFQYPSSLDIFGGTHTVKFGFQHDFSTRTTRLSLDHANISAVLASQTLDVSRSQQLVAKFTFHYRFQACVNCQY